MKRLPNGAKLRALTVQSSGVKLAEKPGWNQDGNERVAFSAIKRDARSARRVELFRATVRGASERGCARTELHGRNLF